MKGGDARRVSTLRLIKAEILKRETSAAERVSLNDAEILDVLGKMIKQRQESLEIYEKAGRTELAAQEREEIAVISGYLPKQMSDDDVKAAIAAAIKDTGAAGMKDMGKVISVLRAKYAGQMDFGKASGLVKSALGG